jgi:hypothetical protein
MFDGTRRLYRASEITLVELHVYLEGLWRQSFELARDVLEDCHHNNDDAAAAS